MSGGTASARLLSLRLQGFKSFAARTVVEFGPGISAVVGPNGSGKSNLADALRWVLGEQGRALRSRRSEDVIFAGSERRSALGMAEATLALDNGDGLVPVDYRVLELGRRLYRSGENEYLLNRQRIRLRDLVDLLDAANLADNAFLFIGQGMVDQALSLRPEERRPLFEEVAGVRRHERRRRKAEEELTESESNLTRVEDILAELRPQARRLAAMAEQQASRDLATEELVTAVLAAAHGRWHDAAARTVATAEDLATARRDVDRAIDGLAGAERGMAAIRAGLEARAADERARRQAHDEASALLTTARIEAAEVATELAAIGRDVARATTEREAAAAARAIRRRELALPVPPPDEALAAAVRASEAALLEATEELAALRAAEAREDDERRAARRAAATRAAEADAARHQADRAAAEAARERARATELESRRAELRASVDTARADAERAGVAIEAAAEAGHAARAELAGHEADLAVAAAERQGLAGRLATTAGQLEALRGRRAQEEERAIARAARRRGGRRLDDGLVLEPELRAAVEAALGEAARGYSVPIEAVPDLAGERGILVPAGAPAPPAVPGPVLDRPRGGPLIDLVSDPRAVPLRDRLAALGGGLLVDAVRHDPTGGVRRILALAGWVPDLAAALEVAPLLPPGAVVVVRDGSVAVGHAMVALGRADGVLERRADEERLAAEHERLAAESATAAERVDRLTGWVSAARARLDAARRAEDVAATERRRAEERERVAGREAEAAAREAAWALAQAVRLEAEAERARAALASLAPTPAPADPDSGTGRGHPGAGTPLGEPGALDAWEERARELRRRRDRLAAELGEQDRMRREAERRYAAAEADLASAEARAARADAELGALAERRHDLEAEASRLAAAVEVARRAETSAREELARLAASDAADRGRLGEAERAALREREQLRAAEDRSRRAEGADLQARLELDAVREQVLVELAGLGDRGLRGLETAAGVATVGHGSDPSARQADVGRMGAGIEDAQPRDRDGDADAGLFETALAVAAERWAVEPPPSDRPSPARLALLRRRYHDLGAANPFARREYEDARARLDGLESQASDLRTAIERTRALIAELNTLIADQFRSTFRALEVAFDRRFQQLFGGGFARLTLTAPEDLAATGVEIVARPPGKKAQPLAMLSGGERALTAVALLFAMLEVRPVPFCVLDEVDAALDEANVGRFAEALRGLAATTQFIVITHNRGTIEVADALYGVTVGEDSVSRVISLRLDEAAAIAGSLTASPTASDELAGGPNGAGPHLVPA